MVLYYVVKGVYSFVKANINDKTKKIIMIPKLLKIKGDKCQKLNTLLSILLFLSLFLKVKDDFLWDYMVYLIEEYHEIYLFLILPFSIIIINWSYKVLMIPIRILYVINLVLYTVYFIAWIMFILRYSIDIFSLHYEMLIPLSIAIYAVFMSKKMIDGVSENMNNNLNEP